MLIAAPATMTGAEVPVESETFTEELAIQIATDVPAPRQARVVLVRTDEPLPPSPAHSRVFRPPRPPVD